MNITKEMEFKQKFGLFVKYNNMYFKYLNIFYIYSYSINIFILKF